MFEHGKIHFNHDIFLVTDSIRWKTDGMKRKSLIEAFSVGSECIQQVELIFSFVTAAATDPMGQARRGGLGHRSVK